MSPLPFAFALAAVALPVGAGIALIPPVDCTVGETCFVQNYADTDPGPGWRDYRCGHLSYDGHDGTDFALATLREMEAGVDVLAPAAGVVTGWRDGMPDIAANAPGAPALEGKDCGNGVAIAHEGGWTSQLCHLKRGSVRVRPGDQLQQGQPVGQIGLSGRTEFPHVHLSLRKDGQIVDPFRPEARDSCDLTPAAALWQEPVAQPPALLSGAGITTATPTFEALLTDGATPPELPARSAALVAWAVVIGPAAGDRLLVQLSGPKGKLVEETVTFERPQARAFRSLGRRMPAGGWAQGAWTATLVLMRGEAELDRQTVTTTLR